MENEKEVFYNLTITMGINTMNSNKIWKIIGSAKMLILLLAIFAVGCTSFPLIPSGNSSRAIPLGQRTTQSNQELKTPKRVTKQIKAKPSSYQQRPKSYRRANNASSFYQRPALKRAAPKKSLSAKKKSAKKKEETQKKLKARTR